MSDRNVLRRALARPVYQAERAAWGFTNRTDMVTLDNGEQVVVQRLGRRQDAEYRLRVMRGLSARAAEAGIPLPRVIDVDLTHDPVWVVYETLPGVPVPDDGEEGIGGPRFAEMSRTMGELLAAFRRLPIAGLELDDLWARPERLAAAAAGWAARVSVSKIDRHLETVACLFAERPVVLAHGDFAPVNILTEGTTVTGLLDFEAVRLADPLFDVAWWAWSVSFPGSTYSMRPSLHSWPVPASRRASLASPSGSARCRYCACSSSSRPALCQPTSRA